MTCLWKNRYYSFQTDCQYLIETKVRAIFLNRVSHDWVSIYPQSYQRWCYHSIILNLSTKDICKEEYLFFLREARNQYYWKLLFQQILKSWSHESNTVHLKRQIKIHDTFILFIRIFYFIHYYYHLWQLLSTQHLKIILLSHKRQNRLFSNQYLALRILYELTENTIDSKRVYSSNQTTNLSKERSV